MDGRKVAEALFAQFGFNEFLTREIPPDVMGKLTKLMEIHDTDLHIRNTKIGRSIGFLEGFEYTLESGQKVEIAVDRPENVRVPRRFRLSDSTPATPKNTYRVAVIEDAEAMLTYDVVLVESGEGWAVICPALRGCVSQGKTEAEALENIQEAIIGWLKGEARDVEIGVLNLLDEYNEAGYPAKRTTVSVFQIKVDAAVH